MPSNVARVLTDAKSATVSKDAVPDAAVATALLTAAPRSPDAASLNSLVTIMDVVAVAEAWDLALPSTSCAMAVTATAASSRSTAVVGAV